LTFTNNNAGTGAYTLTAGTLRGTTSLVLPGAVTLINSTITFGGSSPILITGAVNLGGLNNTLTVTNTAPTVITAVVQAFAIFPARALTLNGPQPLTLTGSNTFNAQTNVLAGTLNIQNGVALGGLPNPTTVAGFSNASVSAGTVVGQGATLQLQGGIS